MLRNEEFYRWAESIIEELGSKSYRNPNEERMLVAAKLLMELKKNFEELVAQLNSTKKELEDLKKELEERKLEFSGLDEHKVSISGSNKALNMLLDVIKNQGWELIDGRFKGHPMVIVKVTTESGNYYVLRWLDFLFIFTEDGYENLKEKIDYITPLSKYEKEKEKLPKALKDALTKALAQYFELIEIEKKISIFMTNILPFARLAGIEVGDPNKVKPFSGWQVANERGNEITVYVYTPEEAYRGFVSAMNSKSRLGFINGGYFSLSTITRILVEFMNYTIQQIALRYPEVVSDALNLATRSVGKLPKTSLTTLGIVSEGSEEVEETD